MLQIVLVNIYILDTKAQNEDAFADKEHSVWI